VLVVDGYELWPRVRPTLTRQLLGLGPDDHALFLRPDADPIRVTEPQLLPLDAALIGRLQLHEASTVVPELPALTPGRIHNDTLGRFALWGFGKAPKSADAEGDRHDGPPRTSDDGRGP
jgi:hypothetical protein